MEFLTSITSGVDTHKPSLFELLSESQLSSLLPPTLRYLLAHATHRHPRYLIHVLNSFDEVYALLFFLVDRHFLRTYGGSFTENFYGLKRERTLRVRAPKLADGRTLHALPRAQLGAEADVREALKLRESDVWKNLAVMIGVPYLKRRMDEAYDVYAAPTNSALVQGPAFVDRNALPQDATVRQRIFWMYKWFLRKVYPSVNAAYYFAMLAFQLGYLFDASRFHDPFLWLIGSRVRRLGQADYRALALAEQVAATAKKDSTAGRRTPLLSLLNPIVFAKVVWPRLLSSLRILLPTSVFALKFLEWWHASDFAHQLARKATEGLELPPPTLPKPSKKPNSAESQLREDEKGKSRAQDSGPSSPPISRSTGLPVFTVPAVPEVEVTEEGHQILGSDLCPICKKPIQTATATPAGHAFCYTCIHRWVEGMHERQEEFMKGGESKGIAAVEEKSEGQTVQYGSREGKWESGAGRCAVTGMRILGGTGGLRRVVV